MTTKNLIVLPAFNEECAIGATIAKLQCLPADQFDLLVVDDGSKDRTSAVVAELARHSRLPLRIVRLPVNSGIGVAVQTGYLFAKQQGIYRYVIQFDADGQHDAASILDLVARCESERLDLCIGSRFLAKAEDNFRSTPLRRLGIRFFCYLIRFVTRVKVSDPTSGHRCAGPRAWLGFTQRYPDDYPEPDTVFWCIRHGMRVGEIPVTMYQRQGGTSSIHSWRSAYYMLKVTLAILVEALRKRECSLR